MIFYTNDMVVESSGRTTDEWITLLGIGLVITVLTGGFIQGRFFEPLVLFGQVWGSVIVSIDAIGLLLVVWLFLSVWRRNGAVFPLTVASVVTLLTSNALGVTLSLAELQSVYAEQGMSAFVVSPGFASVALVLSFLLRAVIGLLSIMYMRRLVEFLEKNE